MGSDDFMAHFIYICKEIIAFKWKYKCLKEVPGVGAAKKKDATAAKPFKIWKGGCRSTSVWK